MAHLNCAHCGKEFQALPRPDRPNCRRFCCKQCEIDGRTPKPLAERFWKYVEITDSCWLWTGYQAQKGYGALMVQQPDGPPKLTRAHRIAWELYVGPIPDGLCVLHHCDVPRCVNFLHHLFLGTKKDNSEDAVRKGRTARGERSGTTTLSETDALEILRLHKTGMMQTEIGKLIGVSKYVVYSVVHRRSWKYLTPETKEPIILPP